MIDPGYRGEIQVVVANIGAEKIKIEAGDRIAQIRIVRRIVARFVEANDLDRTSRGSGGFGSTNG